uniref:Protein SPT2 homolog n=2 Tax=Araucaria cunninghamii TaxID=56994 RepID=A0A0D6QZ44_ARACU
MGSYDRVDFYRKNRDYAGILDEDGGSEEEVEEEVEEEAQEYDEDEDEEGSEERSEPEEDPEVVRESQKYLERRGKLKELERQKLKRKLNGHDVNEYDIDSEKDKKKLPYDNYGSFFGPSQPVVARRVIEETRARMEAAQIAAKVSKEKSYATAFDTRSEDKKPPKVAVSEAKKKAQHLKAARDYSFLFEEDAKIPGSNIDAASKPNHVQQQQAIIKNSTSSKKPAISCKQISSTKEPKGMLKPARQMPPKGGTPKITQRKVLPTAKQRASSDPKKQVNKVGNGLGGSGIQGNGFIRSPPNNGTKVGRVAGDNKMVSLKNGSRSGNFELHRTTMSRPTSIKEQRKPSVLAKQTPKLPNKFKAKPTANILLKPQLKPAKPSLPHNLCDERPKKIPKYDKFEDDIDSGGNYKGVIRQMFGYNPNKYRNLDEEDDSDMEVGFNTIQAEERRSARIAKEEDERELALLEAEEREERLRAIKRKLQNK